LRKGLGLTSLKRKKRIAAFQKEQEEERRRERGDSERFETAPERLQIPTKPVLVGDVVEIRANLEQEYFGGFRRLSPKDHEGPLWNRVLGRVDTTVERFGRQVAWQRAPRRWAAEQPTGPHPFIRQAVREAEQLPPEPTPEYEVRHPHRRCNPCRCLIAQQRFALLEVKNTENRARFARGILREERDWFREQLKRRLERQQVRCQFKPSVLLEQKRFPKLGRVATKLVPKGRTKAALRDELEELVPLFEGEIKVCPPETTTAKLNKRLVGRPPKFGQTMSDNDRQRLCRANKKLKQKFAVIEIKPQEQPHDGIRKFGSATVAGVVTPGAPRDKPKAA
jgi:hypothetical protein